MRLERVCLTNSNKLLPTPFPQLLQPPLSSIWSPSHLFGIQTLLDRLTYKISGKNHLSGSPSPLSAFCTLSSFSTSGYAAPYVWNSLTSPCQATSLSPMKSLFLSPVPSTIILSFPLASQLCRVSSCSWVFYLPLGQTLQTFSHGKKKVPSFLISFTTTGWVQIKKNSLCFSY